MDVDIYKPMPREYGIIYSDPPWSQRKGGIRACRPNQGRSLDYPTCQLAEIEGIHRTAVGHAATYHNVFLWTIDKYLFEAEAMMARLGYAVHARMVWDKGNGPAPAFTVRFAHEYLLWCYREGHMLKPAPEARGVYGTIMREPSTAHSRKPQCAYEILDRMFPDAGKLELFARNRKRGWDCWGNETGLFGEVR